MVNSADQSIYELGLHKIARVDTLTTALRVPGGWIYQFLNMKGQVTVVQFVPFDDEFKPGTKREGTI